MAARPKVHSLSIEVTAYCQQRCNHCYNVWRGDEGAPVEHADGDRLLARVEKLLDAWEIERVTVTGGEPFARKDVFGLFELLRARGVGVQIISNGGLITDAIAERLAPYGVHSVQVTLNGPDAALHEEHVGRGHWTPTLAGIAALQRRGVTVGGCTGGDAQERGARGGDARALARARRHVGRAVALQPRRERRAPRRRAPPVARRSADRLPPGAPLRQGGDGDLVHDAGPPVRRRDRGARADPVWLVRDRHVDARARARRRRRAPQLHAVQSAARRRARRARAERRRGDRGRAGATRRVPSFCGGCVHASSCGGGCGAASEWVLGDARAFPDPLVWQHVDDEFAARLERERRTLPTSSSREPRRLEVLPRATRPRRGLSTSPSRRYPHSS
jgi:hypothetical protein